LEAPCGVGSTSVEEETLSGYKVDENYTTETVEKESEELRVEDDIKEEGDQSQVLHRV
jgi:hypothetical protein